MENTRIDWCDSTWNPVTGCYHGCKYCYAREMTRRFGKNLPDLSDFASRNKGLHLLDNRIDSTPYPFGFEPTFHAYRLNDYISKKGRIIFVCSMADLFGDWVPDEWIEEVFAVCKKAPQHTYLFLTKNPDRYAKLAEAGKLPKGDNMWYGFSRTTKDDKSWWHPDYNIFVSVEPLLEKVDVPACKWVIIGAETGNRKDIVIPEREWIADIVEKCKTSGTPVFMKSSLAKIWGEELLREFAEAIIRAKEDFS